MFVWKIEVHSNHENIQVNAEMQIESEECILEIKATLKIIKNVRSV